MHHLVGPAEIAEMLKKPDGKPISRQRVHKISQDDPDFPKPEAHLAGGKVWKKKDIEQWMKRRA